MVKRWLVITCIFGIIDGNFHNTVKPHYLRKEKHFFESLLHFWNLHKMLHILRKKASFIREIVTKSLTPKNVVSWMPERSCFRKFYSSQSVHRSQTLLKSAWQDFYHYFPLIQDKLGQKTCLFVRCEILNLFCNTLTADDMYSRHSWGKFLLQVKTPLSQKGKTFF